MSKHYKQSDPMVLRCLREEMLDSDEHAELVSLVRGGLKTTKKKAEQHLSDYADGSIDEKRAEQIVKIVRDFEDSEAEAAEGESSEVDESVDNKEKDASQETENDSEEESKDEEQVEKKTSSLHALQREARELRRRREIMLGKSVPISRVEDTNAFKRSEVDNLAQNAIENYLNTGQTFSREIPLKAIMDAQEEVKDRKEDPHDLRNVLNAMGGKEGVNRIFNTLGTAGSNNASLSQGVVATLAGLAFTDQNEVYQMSTSVERLIISGNSYTPTLTTRASFAARTQGTAVAANSQGSVLGSKENLTESSGVVGLDLSALAMNGSPIPAIQVSLAQGMRRYEDGLIKAQLEGTTTTRGLGSGKAISDLTFAIMADIKSKVNGGNRRSIIIHPGVYETILGLNNSGIPIFPQSYAEMGARGGIQYSGIPGTNAILSNSLEGTSGAASTTAAKNAFFYGDLATACGLAVNGLTMRAGVAYNHLKHQDEIYVHYAVGCFDKDINNLIVKVATHTA